MALVEEGHTGGLRQKNKTNKNSTEERKVKRERKWPEKEKREDWSYGGKK